MLHAHTLSACSNFLLAFRVAYVKLEGVHLAVVMQKEGPKNGYRHSM